MVEMHCNSEEKVECAIHILHKATYDWWKSIMERPTTHTLITGEFFLNKLKKK